jgi:hypothetical protein
MKNLDQNQYCLDINNFSLEELQEKFSLLEGNLKAIQAKLEDKSQEYRNLLDEQYDRILNYL